MTSFTYRAVRIPGGDFRPATVLFSAPATDVLEWAGIPQKADIANTETVGWQRTDDRTRVDKISQFLADQRNTLQNPLLLSGQGAELDVKWVPDDGCEFFGGPEPGRIEIPEPSLEGRSLADLFGDLRAQLEQRVPMLAEHSIEPSRLEALRRDLSEVTQDGDVSVTAATLDDHDELYGLAQTSEGEGDADELDIDAVLVEDSHFVEFYESVAARAIVLAEVDQSLIPADAVLGFTREVLEAFLKPLVLVDGQHRLLGALGVVDWLLENDDAIGTEAATRLSGGEDQAQIESDLEVRFGRQMPLSLLMTSEPGEQVFQFVVVNQKATPIKPALLATIVASTLSSDEHAGLEERLVGAGISVENARAAMSLAREPSCPFYGKVERGYESGGDDQLRYSVFSSLVAVFRDLRGGKLYHEAAQNDYASGWGAKFLGQSTVVADFEDRNFTDARDAWSDMYTGSWSSVFNEFWACVRDEFSTDDPIAYNYWGAPRTSQLFNKPSLHILSADFFRFMYEGKHELASAEAVKDLVAQWLGDVNRDYFARDWKLQGIKKDSLGIRRQWSRLWSEYRVFPEHLPDRRNYSKVAGN